MFRNRRFLGVFGISVILLLAVYGANLPKTSEGGSDSNGVSDIEYFESRASKDSALGTMFLGMAIPSADQLYFYFQKNLLSEYIMMALEDLIQPSQETLRPSGTESISLSEQFQDTSIEDVLLGALPQFSDILPEYGAMAFGFAPEEYEQSPEEMLWGFNTEAYEEPLDSDYWFNFETDTYLQVDAPLN